MLFRFRWFAEGIIAGSDMPDAEDIQGLYDKGIRAIISLEPLGHDAEKETERLGINHHALYVEDFSTPINQDIEKFFEIVREEIEQRRPILIHCQSGKGRTGAMGALWLIREKKFSYLNALETVGGVETGGQENLICAFARKHL